VQKRMLAPVEGKGNGRGAPLPPPVGCPMKVTFGCSSRKHVATLSAVENVSSSIKHTN